MEYVAANSILVIDSGGARGRAAKGTQIRTRGKMHATFGHSSRERMKTPFFLNKRGLELDLDRFQLHSLPFWARFLGKFNLAVLATRTAFWHGITARSSLSKLYSEKYLLKIHET